MERFQTSCLKETLKSLVALAKKHQGITSNEKLGLVIGVSGQSISNSCGKSRAADMLSKVRIDALADLAHLSENERRDLDFVWLLWKAERSNDGGVAFFLLELIQGLVPEVDFLSVVERCVQLRQSADKSGPTAP